MKRVYDVLKLESLTSKEKNPVRPKLLIWF
jgi:hypothetical protein